MISSVSIAAQPQPDSKTEVKRYFAAAYSEIGAQCEVRMTIRATSPAEAVAYGKQEAHRCAKDRLFIETDAGEQIFNGPV